MNHLRRVLILGRPNVGKSTLFNRLTGRRKALVHNLPGVTRDLNEAVMDLNGEPVNLIDSGGAFGDQFGEEIFAKIESAVGSANLLLVVVDTKSGINPLDQKVIRWLREKTEASGKAILVLNKVDPEATDLYLTDFYKLGLGPILEISAEHGRGIEDLKAEILKRLPKADHTQTQDAETLPRISIVGKPNVGKSTLLNALAQTQRMITSPIPGTTVDAIDTVIQLNGVEYCFVDTAGIRAKSKTEKGIEVLSFVMAQKSIERSDLVLFLIDGEKGSTDQDEKIGGLIEDLGKSVILVVNKWDTQFKNKEFSKKQAATRIREKIRFLNYAPLLFISAKRQIGLDKIPPMIQSVLEQRRFAVPTKELTSLMKAECEVHNPDYAKFYLCQQIGKNPPTFQCRVNDPRKVKLTLKRHLVNSIRHRWNFKGTPIRIQITKST